MSHEESMGILLRETDKGFWDGRVVATFGDVLKDAGAGRTP
jgi:hypothetical protein